MEVVCQAAHFLKFLFTPCRLRTRKPVWTDPERKKPDWTLLIEYLWEGLDELNKRWLKDDGKLFDDEDAEQYWREVKALFSAEVVKRATAEDKKIAENLLPKLEWYIEESDHLRIPILTPTFLDILAAYIGARPEAYEEVSEIIINPRLNTF